MVVSWILNGARWALRIQPAPHSTNSSNRAPGGWLRCRPSRPSVFAGNDEWGGGNTSEESGRVRSPGQFPRRQWRKSRGQGLGKRAWAPACRHFRLRIRADGRGSADRPLQVTPHPERSAGPKIKQIPMLLSSFKMTGWSLSWCSGIFSNATCYGRDCCARHLPSMMKKKLILWGWGRPLGLPKVQKLLSWALSTSKNEKPGVCPHTILASRDKGTRPWYPWVLSDHREKTWLGQHHRGGLGSRPPPSPRLGCYLSTAPKLNDEGEHVQKAWHSSVQMATQTHGCS